MSALMRQFMAGQLKYAGDITWFLAPYVNSYKRFQAGTFAPTKAIWSRDNRTAGFRLCGEGTKAIRSECRIGGADLNPYLAFAALLAAGLAGIDEKLELEPVFVGDAYNAKNIREVAEDAARGDRAHGPVDDAADGARRRRRGALPPHRPLGAVRIRPPGHRLGAEARVREVLMRRVGKAAKRRAHAAHLRKDSVGTLRFAHPTGWRY